MESRIKNILNHPTYTDRQKMDELLMLDARLYCNLGTDSTSDERADAKATSILIYKAIKQFDFETGKSFLASFNL